MPLPTLELRRTSVLYRVLVAMSNDPSQPSNRDVLAMRARCSAKEVSTACWRLLKLGAIERVGHGRYVRLIEPVNA